MTPGVSDETFDLPADLSTDRLAEVTYPPRAPISLARVSVSFLLWQKTRAGRLLLYSKTMAGT